MYNCCYVFLLFFFFFQAEDGIRDSSVTGVQTCALPILRAGIEQGLGLRGVAGIHGARQLADGATEAPAFAQHDRSEEHTSELQSHLNLVCRLLLEKKKITDQPPIHYDVYIVTRIQRFDT